MWKYNFILLWSYSPYSKAWPPDPEVLNSTIQAENFIGIMTIHSFCLPLLLLYIYIDHIINFHLMGLLLSFIWYQKWWRVTRIHFCIVWGSYWLSESFVSMWYLSGSLPRSLYVFSGGMFGVTLATLNLI